MNNIKVKFLVLMLLSLLPCIAFALNPHDVNNTSLGYSCNSCHAPNKTYGNLNTNYGTNVCFNCHTSGDPKTNKAFIADDFADISGTSSGLQSVVVGDRLKTSHKWLGSEVNVSAKAQRPTDTSRYGLNPWRGPGANMACMRCHSTHGWTAEQQVAPYLRVNNDTDQMCMNCHRARANTTHNAGSHPVNVSYTSATMKPRITAGEFINPPVTDSRYPNAQVKLKSGLVVCSSCHGVHASDSNSATLDNFSSVRDNLLTASDGSLLRVNKRNDLSNQKLAVNVCTNCHKKDHAGTKQHYGTTVQCVDCHSAHVDNVENDANKTPNVYLLRRYMNYSGQAGTGNTTILPTYRKRAVYTDANLSNARWADSTGTGICQSCHNLPATVTQHATLAADSGSRRSDCLMCHNNTAHSDVTPAGGCSDCHGYPPQKSAAHTTTPGGYATGYDSAPLSGRYTLEATTPHLSHAGGGTYYTYACSECHSGNTHSSGGTYRDVFIAKTTKSGAGATYTPNTAPTDSTCSSVYCHSDGKGNFVSVGWNDGKINSIIGLANQTTRCTTCHAGAAINTGSHAAHVSTRGYGCVVCHSDTVNTNTILSNKQNHANAIKDVVFSNSSAAVGGYVGTTCTVACHGNGKVSTPVVAATWGGGATVGACGGCHLTATTVSKLGTGSHTTHFDVAKVPTMPTGDSSCATCHSYTNTTGANHINAVVDVLTPSITVSCGTCHADPYSASFSAPAWGSSAPGCNSCHSVYPITATGPATGSHSISGHAAACISCHASGTTQSVAPSVGHADGDIDVANVGYPQNRTKGSAGASCSSASCHVSPVSTSLIPTPNWGSTGNGCAACHKVANAILTNGPATGSHGISGGGHNVSCITCHAANTTMTVAPSVGHADGDIDVANVGYPQNRTKGSAGASCSSTTCHVSPVSTSSVATPNWGSTGNGCAACHKDANVILTNGPATGSHGISGGGHNVACITCHTASTTMTVAPSVGHADGDIDVANVGYGVFNKTKGSAGSTCSTAVCHGTSSPVWGVNTTNATCTKCHGKPTVLANYSTNTAKQAAPGYEQYAGAPYTNGVSTTAKYGAHDAHVRAVNQYTTREVNCIECHGALPGTGSHANTTVAISFSDMTKNIGNSGGGATAPATRGVLAPQYITGNCSATYCHGGNMGGTAPSWTGTAYLTSYVKNETNCGKCHAALPVVTAKDHSSMIFATQNCNGCHTHEGNGDKHIDGILQASGACDSCHGYQEASWSTAPTINAEGKGAHAKHVAYLASHPSVITLAPLTDVYGSGTSWTNVCGVCHTGGTHMASGVEVGFSATDRLFGVSPTVPSYKGTPGTSSATVNKEKTCSNISCHYFTTPTWSTY